MKVSLYPYNGDSNKYIDLIKESILKLDIESNSFDNVFKDKDLINNTEYFIFNWYESLYTDSLVRQSVSFVKKLYKLMILKRRNKKIVWVLHNKTPHDLKYKFYSIILMKYFIKNSYKIIIHSNESRKVLREIVDSDRIEKKIVYVPHPNYIGVYKENNKNNKKISDENINLLFVGAIKPYKNVDLLIEVFNELNLPNMTLTLAGKIVNDEYTDYIKKIIGNNNKIITDFRFIEDDKISELINKSDLLVLPYDIRSSLNSGTIILAFSNKRTVLSPMIGTIKDIDKKDMFFSYEYENDIIHKEALKENIINISKIYARNSLKIEEMGMKCYLFVEENNSLDKVSECIKKVFY